MRSLDVWELFHPACTSRSKTLRKELQPTLGIFLDGEMIFWYDWYDMMYFFRYKNHLYPSDRWRWCDVLDTRPSQDFSFKHSFESANSRQDFRNMFGWFTIAPHSGCIPDFFPPSMLIMLMQAYASHVRSPSLSSGNVQLCWTMLNLLEDP